MTDVDVIVMFHGYYRPRAARTIVHDALCGVDCRPGWWRVLRRPNSAASLPSDFALLRLRKLLPMQRMVAMRALRLHHSVRMLVPDRRYQAPTSSRQLLYESFNVERSYEAPCQGPTPCRSGFHISRTGPCSSKLYYDRFASNRDPERAGCGEDFNHTDEMRHSHSRRPLYSARVMDGSSSPLKVTHEV